MVKQFFEWNNRSLNYTWNQYHTATKTKNILKSLLSSANLNTLPPQ